MDQQDNDSQFAGDTRRRSFLKGIAATGALTSTGAVASAQKDADVELGGGIGGWLGRRPEGIAGAENPTLEMEPGQTYTVAWENLDGLPHNFVVIDGAGNEVVRSPIIEQQGFVQTVEFEATEEMTEYFCEVHPRSMRGEVNTGGDAGEPQEIVPEGESVGLQRVADGLAAPLGFEVAPGEADRRYIVDQPGQVYVHTDDGLRPQPFLDVGDRLVDLGIEALNGYDERGLLGLAFHPDYQDNGRLFVRYSAPVGFQDDGDAAGEGGQGDQGVDHVEVLSEFRVADGGERVDPDSERVVLQIPSPQDNHNGGAVAFGPEDGYLYTSVGDGGDADDTGPGHVDDWYDENDGGNGQDTTENLLGSILRIDVDGEGDDDRPYAVPEDNPLVGLEGHLDEHYAWGFRNPWRMSFDSQGRLFVADAGQNRYEEVDLVQKGGNYGWNVKEGTHCFSTETPNEPPDECPGSTPDDVRGGEPLIDPIIEYRHRLSTTAFIDGSVVVGGYVYESDTVEHLQDQYVFGNWSGTGVRDPEGEIFVATPPEESEQQQPEEDLARQEAQPIELGGEVQAWTGRSPSDIEGEQNPTLTLVPGETYEVTWENVDGAPHNFAVWDGNDEPVVQSEVVREQGATQTVSFEATEEMATYVCEVHPSSMRGEVRLGEAEAPTETPTATPEETPTQTPERTPTPEEPAPQGVDRAEDIDPQPPRWSVEELTIAGSDDGTLGEYVYGFGRDARGELYVLTSGNFTPFGDTGAVYRLVPAGEGDEIDSGPRGPDDAGGDGNEATNTTSEGAVPSPEGGGDGS